MLTDTCASNMAEYAVIAVVVIAAAVLGFSSFGDRIKAALDNIVIGNGGGK